MARHGAHTLSISGKHRKKLACRFALALDIQLDCNSTGSIELISASKQRPIAAVAAVVEQDGCLLVVQRGRAPNQWRWGFPGGKIEPGETIFAAAERELTEETGVNARALHVLTALDVMGHDADGQLAWHYVLVPVLCRWVSGQAVAASDAAAVRWVPRAGWQEAGLDFIEQFPPVVEALG